MECKLKDKNPARTLVEFKRRYKSCECVQVLLDETDPVVTPEGVRVESALSFLSRFV